MIERERKWLVRRVPAALGEGVAIRQGYVANDGLVSVRVRQKGDRHIGTVKAGAGMARTEVEWSLTPADFGALWPFTEGRRIDKRRHEVPVPGGTAEVDVFAGDLEGLVLVEVEFASDEAAAAFVAPDWFGTEVTDHGGYTNAALAEAGLPTDHSSLERF